MGVKTTLEIMSTRQLFWELLYSYLKHLNTTFSNIKSCLQRIKYIIFLKKIKTIRIKTLNKLLIQFKNHDSGKQKIAV